MSERHIDRRTFLKGGLLAGGLLAGGGAAIAELAKSGKAPPQPARHPHPAQPAPHEAEQAIAPQPAPRPARLRAGARTSS